MIEINLLHYIFLSCTLFCIGILGVIISRHLIKLLISLEFILSAININFVAFSIFNSNVDGQIFVLFIMAIGVCELAIALAILMILFRKTQSINSEFEEKN